jgi:hypothetical protein
MAPSDGVLVMAALYSLSHGSRRVMVPSDGFRHMTHAVLWFLVMVIVT